MVKGSLYITHSNDIKLGDMIVALEDQASSVAYDLSCYHLQSCKLFAV